MVRWTLRVGFSALVGMGLLSFGCAGERDPISRVQPNALNKHFFLGDNLSDASDDPEFYWRNYVVDASASQSSIGIGSWGHVDRIRWEVTENLLIARKAYQIAEAQDDKGKSATDPLAPAKSLTKATNGTVVGVYRIESHFDVKRSYNPATGEETNIVEENASDRPWFQREFMRVDWSQNEVSTYNPMWNEMFTGKVFGDLRVTPLAYAVTDPTMDDAVHFEPQEGYLDITNKYWVEPAETGSPFSDLKGQVPACLVYGIYTGSSTYECDAQEAVVRSSYVKIDPNADFEPLENTKAVLDVVGNPGGIGDSFSIGIVNAGRQKWDPQYGYTDSQYHRFANIHNTWKKSHQDKACDSNADADHDGTADQCSNDKTGYTKSLGSQCDVFVKKCTIPYRDREIRTVSYWVNKEAPADLLDPVDAGGKPTARGTFEDLIFSWNQLLSGGLAFAREVECRRTGGTREDCHGQFFESTSDPKSKDMVSYGAWLIDKAKDKTVALTMCHNPVRDYDLHDVCGETGKTARVGDVRKNFIFYWPYDSRAPWGGIANWEADPLTGEIIGGAAQIMGRSATFAAAMQRDIIQLALGDIKLNDIIEGVPAETYRKILTDGREPKGLDAAEIKRRTDALDVNHLKTTTAMKPYAGATPDEQKFAWAKAQATSTNDPTQVSTAMLEYEALAKKLRGTKYEAQLVDSHWMVDGLGVSPKTPISEPILEAASPLRGLDPGRLQMMHAMIEEGLRLHGVCFMDSEAPVTGSAYVQGSAGWFKAKYGTLTVEERGKKIYDDLWKEAVKGIALHEIGHSLGMLHQFASSWDAVNYNPQYWQLRTKDGTATKSCSGSPRPAGDDSCMGPRYLDPETPDEQGVAGEPRPGIDYFANTSTMEYQLERFGETVGLGTYDYHTMKALYGRVLDTFDDKFTPLTQQKQFSFRMYSQLIDRDLLFSGGSIPSKHYTETARLMKVFDPARDCRPATEEEKKIGGWRIVHNQVCSPPPKDVAAWRDFRSDAIANKGTANEYRGAYWHAMDPNYTPKAPSTAEKERAIRWYYRWGVSNNAYAHTNGSDAGADIYEVTKNTILRFDQTYPWAYFRRHNREYYFRTLASQTSSRYFQRLRAFHWQVATNIARSTTGDLADDDNERPYVMAQTDIFNTLARVIMMPEPGTYSSAPARRPVDALQDIYDTAGTGTTGPFNINIVDGRYIAEDYDNDLGGSWDYLTFVNHAGFGVEKENAIQALVDGRPTLYTISRDNFLDGRGVKINFRNDMPQAIDRLVGGLLSEDWESIAPFVKPGDKNPSIQLLDLNTITAPPKRPAGSLILFPNVGYKVQLATAVYVSLFSLLNTDMSLINKMRVWVEGSVDAKTLPDDQAIKFTDPNTSYTYVAKKYGTEVIDGKTVEKGIASRMLAHANAMTVVAYRVKRLPGDGFEYDKFGRPVLELDTLGQPQIISADMAGQLTQYVGLMDAVREITYKLGYGPLGGGSLED